MSKCLEKSEKIGKLGKSFQTCSKSDKNVQEAIQDTSVQQNSRCNDQSKLSAVSCCCVQSKIAKIQQGVNKWHNIGEQMKIEKNV